MRVLSSLLRRAALAWALICFAATFSIADAAAVKAAGPRSAAPNQATYPGLLARALTAIDAHDLTAGAALLTEAYRLSPLPEVLYHLGRIAVIEGRTLDARDLFRRFLADPGRQTDQAATQTAEQFSAQPAPLFGSVNVLADPGATVLVDDRVVGVLPLPLPLLLSPGAHSVALEFIDKRLETPVPVQAGRLIELRMIRASGTVLLSVLPAILFISDAPSVSAESRRLFAEALEQAARAEQSTLLAAERARTLPLDTSESRDCLASESCLQKLAQHNAIDFLLRQRTQSDSLPAGTRLKSQLSLWRVDIATPAATAAIDCPQCDAKQAAAKLKEAAAKLFSEGLSRPHGTLHLATEPVDAEVQIGEAAFRRAPVDDSLWAATYELTIRAPGYATEHRTIAIADGAKSDLKVRLSRPSAPPPQTLSIVPSPSPKVPRGRPRWRLGVGGALIAIGGGLVVAGAVGLPRNGQCVDVPAAFGAACPRLYDTQLAGGLGVGIGAAIFGGGILLVALPGRARNAARRAPDKITAGESHATILVH